MKLTEKDTTNSKRWLWGFVLPVIFLFIVISALSFSNVTHSDEYVPDFFVTTSKGELLEVDIDSGVVRIVGDAGYFNGREPGWTSLSFDPTGRLFTASNVKSELSKMSHLYRVDPATGAILEEVGSTNYPYISDIDFALDGSLYGSYWDDWAGVLLIDPDTAISTPILNFGDDMFSSGAISVHPITGDLWSVENNNSAEKSIFRLDQDTGAVIKESKVYLGLGGVITNFGFTSLTITPEGRFFGTVGRSNIVGRGIYEINPLPDPVSGLAEITQVPLDIPGEVEGNINGIEFIFQGVEVDIDINPDDPDNKVRLSSRGKLTVAILSTESFDAVTIDSKTLVLAGSSVIIKESGKAAASLEDVNDDSLLDLVVHIGTKDLNIRRTSKVATLYGKTFDGISVRGLDSVNVVSR